MMGLLDRLLGRNKENRRNFLIFNAVLIGAALLVIIYNFIYQCVTCYLSIFLVGGVAGLLIETAGTKLSLWEYYNKEKPPALTFFMWGSAVTIVIWFMTYMRLF